MWEIQVQSRGREDLLEKEMATHFSIPAWRISWTEEPCGLQVHGLQRVRHGGATDTFTSNLQSKKNQKDPGVSSPRGTQSKCSAAHAALNPRGGSSFPEPPAASSSQARTRQTVPGTLTWQNSQTEPRCRTTAFTAGRQTCVQTLKF